MNLASALVVIGLAHAQLWQWLPNGAHVWNLTGAVMRLFLLIVVANAFRSRAVIAAVVTLCMFELVVIGCTTAHFFIRWPIALGKSCTATLGLPLGLIGGLMGLAVLIWGARWKT